MAKIIQPEIIQYTGFENIDEEQKRLLDKISSEYYLKIKRQLHNVTTITVHLKCYNKTGSRCKYSIHLKAIAPTKIYVSTKASDWDFSKTLHKAFQDLEVEIKHSMKSDKFPREVIDKYQI